MHNKRLNIAVQFYDDVHEKIIKKKRGLRKLYCSVVSNTIEVYRLDFLSYLMFSEQKSRSGWHTYRELRQRLPGRIRMLNDYLDLAITIRSKFPVQECPPELTSRVGVGLSLCAISSAFSMIEADWGILPIDPRYASMDYEIASDGVGLLQIESKGSVVDDPMKKCSSISNHKASIAHKKSVQRNIHNRAVLLGGIAAFTHNKNMDATLSILDPPAFSIPIRAKRYKLLARLSFWAQHMSRFYRGQFLGAIYNRIVAITNSGDGYESLNRQPLFTNQGQPISDNPLPSRLRWTNQCFGNTIVVSETEFFLIGIGADLLNLIVAQDFNAIIAYAAKPTITENVTGKVQMSKSTFMRHDFPEYILEDFPSGSDEDELLRINVRGWISQQKSGIYYGILRPIHVDTSDQGTVGKLFFPE